MPPSACIAGIKKITILHSYGRTDDFLYDSAELTIWTTTELNVGILAGSIPCLKPLYRILREKSGWVPKDSPSDIPSFSYTIMQSSDVRNSDLYRDDSQIERGIMRSLDIRSTDVYRDDSQIERGESEMDLQTFRETELVKPANNTVC